jgi:hypothetical protein
MTNAVKHAGTKLTRRSAIKTGAGILSATGLGAFGCLMAQTPQNSEKFTKASPSPSPTPADNDTVYAVLTAWLLVATSNNFAAALTACDLEKQAGIPYCWAQAAISRANSAAASPIYKAIRAEFNYFIANVVPYSGPACPTDIGTLKAIANIKPTVGSANYPCATPCP